ncbi:MAG: flavoprotein, partial [Desulfurococcaceae archaeon]
MSSVRMPEDISMLTHQSLSGKKLILGVTGSSSIYRSIDLARRLIRLGASIKVLMTRFAAKLISPDLFHWATGSKPYVEMSGETEHIDLAKWADALIIAPSTLNTMSKIAHGIGDELLPLTAIAMLGNGKKVVIVPAMNIRLFRSPQYS